MLPPFGTLEADSVSVGVVPVPAVALTRGRRVLVAGAGRPAVCT